MISIDLYI